MTSEDCKPGVDLKMAKEVIIYTAMSTGWDQAEE